MTTLFLFNDSIEFSSQNFLQPYYVILFLVFPFTSVARELHELNKTQKLKILAFELGFLA